MLQSEDVPSFAHAKIADETGFRRAGVEAAIYDLLVAVGEAPTETACVTPRPALRGPIRSSSQACTPIPTTY